MAAYSQLELKYARPLSEALIADPDFRTWFAGDPTLASAIHDPALQASRRSPTMKNPYGFNYWCGKDSRCTCRIGTGIEIDILLVFQRPDGRRTALHVEVKRPGDRLGNGQALSYPRRAACWTAPETRPRTVPPHDDHIICLTHEGTGLSSGEAAAFHRIVQHDEIARRLPVYPLP